MPNEVRDALAQAASEEGLSLSGYVRRELEHVARRRQTVRDNAAVIRETQSKVAAHVSREAIRSVLDEDRGS